MEIDINFIISNLNPYDHEQDFCFQQSIHFFKGYLTLYEESPEVCPLV